MRRVELAILGAGPSGLSAAIEAACFGLEVVVFDADSKPGGQLFNHIDNYFVSSEHRAKERGFRIGECLIKEASELNVQVELNSLVTGIYDSKVLHVSKGDWVEQLRANAVIIATGHSEKHIEVDAVCMDVGLSPMYQLCRIAGCEMIDDPKKGGNVPLCDEFGATTIPGIYVAADGYGIEEDSSAMIGGRIAGAACSWEQGYISRREFDARVKVLRKSCLRLMG